MLGRDAWLGRGCDVVFDLLSLQRKYSYLNGPIL